MEKIKIPKKFKEEMLERYDLDKAKKSKIRDVFIIREKCILCAHYQGRKSCLECPFALAFGCNYGCSVFINEILGHKNSFSSYYFSVIWPINKDKEVRAQIKKIKKEALKRIEWV